MKRLDIGMVVMSVMMVVVATGCGGGGAKKKGPPVPANPHGVTKRPAGAQDKGKMMAKVTPPKAPAGAPQISTIQPGDDGDEQFTWQEDLDGDGTPDDVVEVLDDETGDVVLAGSWSSPCDDGSALQASFFVLQHPDGSGSYLFAAADICGEGAAMYGCAFDTAGNDTKCGSCTIPADGTDFVCEDTSPP